MFALRLSAAFLSGILASGLAFASGDEPVRDWQVTVDGRPVKVWRAAHQFWEKEYYFASFDLNGAATVKVRSSESLKRLAILPESAGISPDTKTDREFTLTLRRPIKLSIEREGRIKPLLLFANAPERGRPSKDDPNVIWFGPGEHEAGVVRVCSNQTLYLEEGAVVKGAIRAEGNNILICGRGIVDGGIYPHERGPNKEVHGSGIYCVNCTNLVVRDITYRNPWSWELTFWFCKQVSVDNVKICGGRFLCDDAIDIVNCSDVTIRNSFLRSQDDNVAIKGRGAERNGVSVENILVENCIFWYDSANGARIGFESNASHMSGIVMRDIDVLHTSARYREPDEIWSHAVVWLQPSNGMAIRDSRFEDFRVHSDGLETSIILVHAEPRRCWAGCGKYINGDHQYELAGHVKNCLFRNLSVTGQRCERAPVIRLKGYDESHRVENVAFENVTVFGDRLTEKSSIFMVDGRYVSGLSVR